ncbi:hypothetical protein NDN08_002894 [Rhodosorus marinus]|uniref:DNA 5'-3' helicase n=1 Tax=Rhodosorus marinus TaxID=101924 RepID=A0AAV8V0S7_9RHOD|nr:hypothetical protein NDN08_002894 [Rhodosorus marinus]
MRFNLDGLEVFFPYESVYPEQLEYMRELKKALDAGGHAVLEMPSGTGKTITLLSLITSYILSARGADARKLVYCTRTVEEMQKVLYEMRILSAYRRQYFGSADELLCVGLASRRHLCIHETVSNLSEGYDIDSACRALTAPWIRDSAIQNTDVEVCSFFEGYENEGKEAILKAGVYDLAEFRRHGTDRGWCPYFFARRMLTFANVIVYSYHYLLDPKVAALVSRDLTRDAIVVFDEAHNIDNVCIESLSVNIDESILGRSRACLGRLARAVERSKAEDASRLREEYERIMASVPLATMNAVAGSEVRGPPVLPEDVLHEAVPTEIRKAENFLAVVQVVINVLRSRMQLNSSVEESPNRFVEEIVREGNLEDKKDLRFTSDRLTSLLKTLEVSDWSEYRPLHIVSDFVTVAATYLQNGFTIIFEPFDSYTDDYKPILQLACLDASLAIRPVTNKFRTVVITSGTISPLDFYPRMLSFRAAVAASFNMSLDRKCVCPLVITHGGDQTVLSSKFQDRSNPAVARNYGDALLRFAERIPDGLVVFFPSYAYMSDIVSFWQDNDVLNELQERKLVFVETQDPAEASLAIANFRKGCDSGRGAVLLSVARGKAAEGIDFDGHYGRCVILFGVPFQYTESKTLRARMEYLRKNYQVREDDFLVFDAMRQAAQCVGRVIRNKKDYGVMVFADRRFSKHNLKSKLPKWIGQFLTDQNSDLQTATALAVARKFLLDMSQAEEQ